MAQGQPARGNLKGTGEDMTIRLGFIPRRVNIIAQDSGAQLVWQEGMGDGTAMVGTGTLSFLKEGGVTVTPGTPGRGQAGFTLGKNAVNAKDKLFFWEAFGDQ